MAWDIGRTMEIFHLNSSIMRLSQGGNWCEAGLGKAVIDTSIWKPEKFGMRLDLPPAMSSQPKIGRAFSIAKSTLSNGYGQKTEQGPTSFAKSASGNGMEDRASDTRNNPCNLALPRSCDQRWMWGFLSVGQAGPPASQPTPTSRQRVSPPQRVVRFAWRNQRQPK